MLCSCPPYCVSGWSMTFYDSYAVQQSESQICIETKKALLLAPIHLLSVTQLCTSEVKQLIAFSPSACRPTARCFTWNSQDRINTAYVLYVNACWKYIVYFSSSFGRGKLCSGKQLYSLCFRTLAALTRYRVLGGKICWECDSTGAAEF